MPATIRILMVEDNPQDAALAEREVRKADVFCTFRRVDSREGMVAALRDYAPDVILTDHSLPTFSARDALALAQQLAPGTPVIVVTGVLGDEPAVQYLQLGAADYILKDHLHRLGPALLRALDTKRSREEQARAHQLQAATFRIAQAAIATPGLHTLLPVIHQIVSELMPAKNLYIALYEAATDLLSFPYAVDEHDTDVAPRRPGKGLTEYVLRTGEPLLVTPEVQAALEAQGQVELVGAPSIDWLGIPLKVGDRTIGVLAVQTYTPGVRYDKREKDLLQFVSAQVALAIERSRAEDESRAAAARLNAIIDAALDAVITMDGTGVIRSWSPQAERMFGWSGSEASGRKLSATIVPPQHRAAHERGLARFLATGEGPVLNRRIEITGLHRDGREIPVELTITPLRVGEAWLFSAFVRDITERKWAEEALARSETTYRSLVQDSPFGIFRSTPDGRLLAVNPALVSILGYDSEAELLARNVATDVYVDPDERKRFVDQVSKLGSLGAESLWRRKDGKTVTVRQTGRAVRDAQGSVEYFNVILEDITERRLLENQLRQAQKMEAVGRLAGGIAHDFNNILTAIFGYSDLLRDELPEGSPARQDTEEIRKAAERAAALTRQLLAFSRQQLLEPVVLNTNDLVEEFDKMLRRLIGEDVELRLALAPDLGNVRADPGQLQQVLMNVAVNARDAMPTGGKLLIETANAHLTDQYAELHQSVTPGAYVMVAVSDTGVGMDAETRARIFEPFFTTKDKGKGTGLGLSTVYGIVKQSGGYVWVYSELGRGTTFKFYLPRVEATAERPLPPREAATFAGTETILLAEDDEMLRPLAKGVLEKLGYTVLEAENASRALALAQAHKAPIQLLVSDVIMPGLSGRELAQRLVATRPETRVLYVSGYTDDAIVHHGMLEPGLNFLQKPFTPSALARKVREVLDHP
ncbi:MAG TPA: PAS domain S-box protein [Gemmatimonadales bacterium]|nr:PAS domain S-box protein [Gemmatimonadales bacterium]